MQITDMSPDVNGTTKTKDFSMAQWMGRLFKDTDNKVYLFLLLGLLVGTFGSTSLTPPSNKLSYGLFGVLLLVFFYRTVVRDRLGKLSGIKIQFQDVIPLLLLAVWCYGLVRGAYLGNDNVLRNFAGMTLYGIYYVLLVARLDKFDLLRCVLYAAAVNVCYMFGFFIWDKAFSPYFYGHAAFAAPDVRDYYSETLILVAMPVILIFYALFSSKAKSSMADPLKKRPMLIVLLCLYVFALIQISFSKAAVVFYIACLGIFALYFCKNVFRFIRHRQFASFSAIVLAACLALYPAIITLSAYIPSTVVDQITAYIPDAAIRIVPDPSVRAQQALLQGEARVVRDQQAAALIEDLSFFGKGLGATLDSGYKRDPAGYGFEANYWNLVHKFGVFSLVIAFTYLFMAVKILTGLARFKSRYFSLASCALGVGLIMGFGNPVLMSPVMVCLQCIVFYWLRSDGREHTAAAERSA